MSAKKNQDRLPPEETDNEPAAGDQDSSATRDAGPLADVDEEEGEDTRLNRSQVQEGPKGGRPVEERRSA